MILLIGFIVATVMMFVSTIKRIKKLNSLSNEEREILKNADKKIEKIKKKMILTRDVGVGFYIITLLIFLIFIELYDRNLIGFLNKFNFNNEVSAVVIDDEIYNDLDSSDRIPIQNCSSNYIEAYLAATTLYILVYAMVRIISYNNFLKKISVSNDLSDKEKELLKIKYGSRTSLFVFLTFIIESVVYVIQQVITVTVDKPIIYLYPEKEEKVKVKLSKKEDITHSYPKYKDGWNVIASPDGKLKDLDTNKEQYSLYYEAKSKYDVDMKKGFCVKGEDTIVFLEDKLEKLGLNYKEAEEFIIYWLPQLEKNKYNYIYFKQKEEVDKIMPLDITPAPDSLIRVLMCFKPLNSKIEVEEQDIITPERNGFTVVEWGGSKI